MNRTPLILAIVLLLLPVLYVGSYLALVRPEADWLASEGDNLYRMSGYRINARCCAVVFWPLEQIDRKVRPKAWERDSVVPPIYRHVRLNPPGL